MTFFSIGLDSPLMTILLLGCPWTSENTRQVPYHQISPTPSYGKKYTLTMPFSVQKLKDTCHPMCRLSVLWEFESCIRSVLIFMLLLFNHFFVDKKIWVHCDYCSYRLLSFYGVTTPKETRDKMPTQITSTSETWVSWLEWWLFPTTPEPPTGTDPMFHSSAWMRSRRPPGLTQMMPDELKLHDHVLYDWMQYIFRNCSTHRYPCSFTG